jgi:hypothetical protein
MYAYMCICISIYLSSICHLSVIYLSVIYLSIHLSIYLSKLETKLFLTLSLYKAEEVVALNCIVELIHFMVLSAS